MTKKNFSESEEQAQEAVQNEAYNEANQANAFETEFASESNYLSESEIAKATGVVSTGGGLAKKPVGAQMTDLDEYSTDNA